MSKKQTEKKKVILKLKAQESYIVADSEFFIRIAESLELLAKLSEDKNQKTQHTNNANFIRNNSYTNVFNPQINDYEDWD
jgi:hypothetical protein